MAWYSGDCQGTPPTTSGGVCTATFVGIPTTPQAPNTPFNIDSTLKSSDPYQCEYVTVRIDGVAVPTVITGTTVKCIGGASRSTANTGAPGTHTVEYAVNDTDPAIYPNAPAGRTKSICATATFTTAGAAPASPSDTLPNNPLTLSFTVAAVSTTPSPSPTSSPSPSPSPSPSTSPSPAGAAGTITVPSPTPSPKAVASPKASTSSATLPTSGSSVTTILGIMGGGLLLLLGLALAL